MQKIATFRPLLILATASACALLSGCTHSNKPSVPTFVTYDSQQLAAVNAGSQSNAGTLADIKDRLSAIQETPFAGQDVLVGDTAVNIGVPAKGIKVILRGSAFDNGILGAPSSASVSTQNRKGTPGPKSSITLTQDDSGAWKGDADLLCEKNIMVSIYCPARKGGSGEVQLLIAPKDKGGASSAVFTHSYTVRSESDDSENSSETD